MTATYTKPTKIPRWADTSANIIEPPEVKKDQGWLFEEIPPSAFENWRTKLTGEWMKWLNERLFDGTTKDELLIKSPGAGTEALRITDTFLRSSRPLYFDASNTYGFLFNSGSSQLELWAGGNLALYANASGLYIDGDLTIEDDLVVPGGLAVGIATPTVVDDQIQLGDPDFHLDFDAGGSPRIRFGAGGDDFGYLRGNDHFFFKPGNVERLRVWLNGISVNGGCYVGGAAGTANDNQIYAEDIIASGTSIEAATFLKAGNGTIRTPDSSSYIYNSATGGNIYCNLAGVMWWTAAGLTSIYGGLRVGDASAPTDNNISAVGSITAGGALGGASLNVGGGTVTCGAVGASGDITTSAGIRAGGASDPGAGDGIFTNGLVVGFDAIPTASQIKCGNTDFYMKWDGTDPILNWDANDYLLFDRSDKTYGRLDFIINSVAQWKMYRHPTYGWGVLEAVNGGYISSNAGTPNLFITGLSISDAGNVNGTCVVSGPGTANDAAIKVSWDNGFDHGRAIVVNASWGSGRYAQLGLEPTAIDGVGTLPDTTERWTGDVFAGTEGGVNLWFFDGAAWVLLS